MIDKEVVPPDCNVLQSRFVTEINSTEGGVVKFASRFFIGGHRNKLKRIMTLSQTLKPASKRRLIALAWSLLWMPTKHVSNPLFLVLSAIYASGISHLSFPCHFISVSKSSSLYMVSVMLAIYGTKLCILLIAASFL